MRFAPLLFMLVLPITVWARNDLTESEAVRLGLARAGLAELEAARIQAAEADVVAAGLLPNPVLSYSHDRVNASPDTREHVLMLSQTLDLSGRRGPRREAARRRVDIAGIENAARAVELAAETRRAFHDLLYRQEIIRATESWTRHFDRVEALVGRLAKAGEASGYDRRRLARERREIEARLAGDKALLDRQRARLAALIGTDADPVASGALPPPALPPLEPALSGLAQRPDLVALVKRAEASALEERAARRARIPDLTVGIGPKWVDNGFGADTGIALSLSLPLPVFDRQQAARQKAAAEATQARAEHRLILDRAEGELRGLHREAEGLRAAAMDYRARAAAASPELLRIAEAAYQGGESSLLELLDAYRGALEVENTALELEKRARDARIEFDLLTGSVEP